MAPRLFLATTLVAPVTLVKWPRKSRLAVKLAVADIGIGLQDGLTKRQARPWIACRVDRVTMGQRRQWIGPANGRSSRTSILDVAVSVFTLALKDTLISLPWNRSAASGVGRDEREEWHHAKAATI
ncbi:hypothetical protein [Novosphingobium sp. PhB55]|uniref:hypothetical protein n=1 Tax=Novosphingobium sp. PhB55 TaxID=2485106 RepID=UPI001AB04DAB|nr:hypothetical protein [Novosphingobium sp. PhB55]